MQKNYDLYALFTLRQNNLAMCWYKYNYAASLNILTSGISQNKLLFLFSLF